ncbi:MAG TPA: DUF456 domain-containing protein [Methylomirabilota bacterium]|nr:DUF456 domain-containing protein [Methylomirabilota bacterium]
MDTHTIAAIAVAILFLAGLVGSVVPWMPGPLLILAGALLWAVVTDFATLGVGRLAVLTVLAVVSFLLSFVVGAIGARRYGGSRWGVAGAVVGALVGLFFGPLGLLVGPVAGAVIGEIAHGATLEGGIRSGFGALIGLLGGLVADLVLSLSMIGLFLWWAWA